MPTVDRLTQPLEIERSVAIVRTPRVLQLESLFEIPPSERSAETYRHELALDDDWHIGAIIGPSGAGKSTMLRAMFGDDYDRAHVWPETHAVVDGFPAELGIKQVVELMSSVGFSSPPSWLRPYGVLSTGERFRVDVARTLAETAPGEVAVIDEYTSVVDRTVARIGSAAIAKAVRRSGRRLVVATCHYDVIDWLQPDWVYEPHTAMLERRVPRRRPDLELTIRRVDTSAWELFRKHHYLDRSLNATARCFVAYLGDVPVAFNAWLTMPSGTVQNAYRSTRTVCLPDYQGVGIGVALVDTIASIVKAVGKTPYASTGHPAVIAHRARSPLWSMHRKPGFSGRDVGTKARDASLKATRARNRLIAGFKYVGSAHRDRELALAVWNGADDLEIAERARDRGSGDRS